ncbi:S41 family peptidase [Siphonobacter sp. SORGH_AS_1065]|uniref:S41 family peptidase n=1 Tax=Siphonobacter sp. SORGH_AS_1065 TaxID=3041795 RepID=UPI002781168C|nr:S41 family peptidase [Siphonobacter sp. SORGH_AS_1065]MDQ1090143.1 carboxyl-terminal processing protease [Siphonobacter sp. SORGH_AS_1065]
MNTTTCYLALALGLLTISGVNAQVNPKEKFASALRAIEANYVDPTDDEQLTDAAIRAMIKELDPHSQYMSRKEAEAMNQAMSGNYAGIGIQYLMQNDSLFITQIVPEGPAEKAGLRAGDRIIAIDGQQLAGNGLSNLDIMKKIRGEKGQPISLTLVRRSSPDPLTVALTRGTIPNRSIRSYYMVDKTIGYISLGIFNTTTRSELDQALNALKAQGMKSLILDLQGNGGGYVQAAIGAADEFLNQEKLVFYSVPRDGGKDYYYTGGQGQFMTGNMVVLIDQSTASSSEILTGALQDWDRAVVVGQRSFGKGLMQKPVTLLDGSVLQLTGARYYTPAGRSIQKPYHGHAYEDNLTTRLKSGELTDAQNIHFPDSLKYKTLVGKRTVYGGGGIMPDVFVPIDTLEFSPYFQQLVGSGIISQIAFEYMDQNRATLQKQYPDFQSYEKNFQLPADLMERLAKMGITPKGNEATQARLKTMAELHLKAQIASQLFGSNTYYQRMLNSENGSYLRAIAILKKPKQYEQYLQISQH